MEVDLKEPTIRGGRVPRVSDDELQQARAAGQKAAEELVANDSPTDPLLAVAWAAGYGSVDAISRAVAAARSAGVSWRQLGIAMGMHPKTVQSKYGQPDRHKRYFEKRRQADEGTAE